MGLVDYLDDVARLLKYHYNSNISSYPMVEGVKRFLERTNLETGSGVTGRKEMAVSAEVEYSEGPALPAHEDRTAREEAGLDSFAAISNEIAACRICGLHQMRIGFRPGSLPSAETRLMLVGEWLSCRKGLILPDSTQFGVEEDHMVVRMLHAIHISMDKVFITNVIKCAVAETCKPTAEEAIQCFPYLRRQIAVVDPEVICCMGLMPARILLGGTLPLSRLRGTSHSLNIEGKRRIPVVVTYHPTFLLQNPTMKKAAWIDLQNIGRLLKTL
jgi:DNA polymerase